MYIPVTLNCVGESFKSMQIYHPLFKNQSLTLTTQFHIEKKLQAMTRESNQNNSSAKGKPQEVTNFKWIQITNLMLRKDDIKNGDIKLVLWLGWES